MSEITINTEEEFDKWLEDHKNKHYRQNEVLNKDYISIEPLSKNIFNVEFDLHLVLTKILDIDMAKFDPLQIDVEIKFMNIEFNKGISAYAVNFKKNIVFKNCKFETISFHRCNFDILNVSLGQIPKVAEIANCTASEICFTQIRTSPDTYLRIVDSDPIELLSIDTSILQGWGEIKNSKIIRLSLKYLTLNSNLIINNTYFKCKNWQTACILKNEELKRNNFVESLKFQAEEKKLLEIELNDNKTLSNLSDRFSLLLGKIVNDHGQNWVLALGWTILIWIVTFAIFSLRILYTILIVN